MAKDAYYFSHDSNAKDDPKCVMVIEQLGLEGYGIFWILIETLRDQPEYKYPLALIPAIARRYNTTTQKVEAVVKGYQLFQFTEDEFFFSPSLMGRMQHLEYKRQIAIEAGKKSAEKKRLNQPTFNDTSTDVQPTLNQRSTSKVKESKVKESKVKESKVKESKVNKNIYSDFSSNSVLLQTLNDFENMRNSIKNGKMTDRARVMMLEELNKLADTDEKKIAVLEQSIFNNWKGIFPLKITGQAKISQKANGFDNFSGRKNSNENVGDKYIEKPTGIVTDEAIEKAMAERRANRGEFI